MASKRLRNSVIEGSKHSSDQTTDELHSFILSTLEEIYTDSDTGSAYAKNDVENVADKTNQGDSSEKFSEKVTWTE